MLAVEEGLLAPDSRLPEPDELPRALAPVALNVVAPVSPSSSPAVVAHVSAGRLLAEGPQPAVQLEQAVVRLAAYRRAGSSSAPLWQPLQAQAGSGSARFVATPRTRCRRSESQPRRLRTPAAGSQATGAVQEERVSQPPRS